MLFHVTPQGIFGIEAFEAAVAREGMGILVYGEHVLPLNGSCLEGKATDLTEERANIGVDRKVLVQVSLQAKYLTVFIIHSNKQHLQ